MMSSVGTGGGLRYHRPGLFGGFRFFPPVIKWLLLGNAALWLATDLILPLAAPGGSGSPGGARELVSLCALHPPGKGFLPWQLLTYMFLHAGPGHLFFNMFALWMFGMEMENLWGSRRFLLYYLGCGAGAGVAHMFIAPLVDQEGAMMGASGAVFGVLTAFGMLFPDRPIFLYFLLPIRAKFFIAGYIALELLVGIAGTGDGVAHFAHLGGAAVGFLLTPVLAGRVSFLSGGRMRGGSGGGTFPFPGRPRAWGGAPQGTPGGGNRGADVTQEAVDAILDKINSSGYQSLTEEEWRILRQAGNRLP
ncbi:MAG: rhomboid family intramembrane serine protease [Bacteroidota bacterium]